MHRERSEEAKERKEGRKEGRCARIQYLLRDVQCMKRQRDASAHSKRSKIYIATVTKKTH